MKFLGVDKAVDNKSAKKKRKVAHYRFLQAIYLSFFSGRLYIDVIRRWRGLGLLYLVCMLAVVTLPYAVHLTIAYRDMMEQKLFVPFKQLPPFSVRDGEVYFYSPMPYEVKNRHNEVVAVIDTEGKIKQLPYFLYPKATLLITKNDLHLRL
ncbi:MAG: DUF1189 domain-containing protein, partial [Gammaproteobacteria bacterium]|nr:DUF1189 domain-containing protein [Gammaproteobacteria bacterium]